MVAGRWYLLVTTELSPDVSSCKESANFQDLSGLNRKDIQITRIVFEQRVVSRIYVPSLNVLWQGLTEPLSSPKRKAARSNRARNVKDFAENIDFFKVLGVFCFPRKVEFIEICDYQEGFLLIELPCYIALWNWKISSLRKVTIRQKMILKLLANPEMAAFLKSLARNCNWGGQS